MKIIVTCGPSYEPIDGVRRITNFSTGELGILLTNELIRNGFKVFCLKGAAATHPDSPQKGQCIPFTTNDSLVDVLHQLSGEHDIAAVFHAAALCDFKVRSIVDAQGTPLGSPKIASRVGALTLHLEPTTKVIANLRALFPRSVLVGWKYELAGTRAEALDKAWQQIRENETDACVLNGAAYGAGFAVCENRERGRILECPDKASLVKLLTEWLRERLKDNACLIRQ